MSYTIRKRDFEIGKLGLSKGIGAKVIYMKMKSTLIKSGFIEQSIDLMEQLNKKERLTEKEQEFIESVNEMCDVIQCWKETKKSLNKNGANPAFTKIK
ncbi:hypothetical protein [Bacillus sp. Marseille-P3661]|uniref:hypothetical protein n=1 Tax=Bacillus sp. Marseille-P3661 TaxID=1936234 RepID=UPI0015E19FBE|nr:hypothetical protein [Bacillus sp. Marseille-P3661]